LQVAGSDTALRQLGESEAFAAAMRAAGVAEQVVTEPGTVRPVALGLARPT